MMSVKSKNIHVLPTEKPSEFYSIDGRHKLANSTMAMDWYISSVGYKPHNIYITSDEEIKEGDWCLNEDDFDKHLLFKADSLFFDTGLEAKKIILTTDQDLIKDGVQAIDDEFLEWFVKNPSYEFVEIVLDDTSFVISDIIYKIIIQKEEAKQNSLNQFLSTSGVIIKDPQKWEIPKQETLEEAAERNYNEAGANAYFNNGFIRGVKWQQEQGNKKFSEEEIILYSDYVLMCSVEKTFKLPLQPKEWFEQFKNK